MQLKAGEVCVCVCVCVFFCNKMKTDRSNRFRIESARVRGSKDGRDGRWKEDGRDVFLAVS